MTGVGLSPDSATRSRHAERLLADWDRELVRFRQIVPKEMLARLVHPVARDAERAAAGDDD